MMGEMRGMAGGCYDIINNDKPFQRSECPFLDFLGAIVSKPAFSTAVLVGTVLLLVGIMSLSCSSNERSCTDHKADDGVALHVESKLLNQSSLAQAKASTLRKFSSTSASRFNLAPVEPDPLAGSQYNDR